MKAMIWKVIKDSFRVGFWASMVAVVGCILMVHVWNQYRIVQLGYEIAEVTQEHRHLLEQNKKLAIEAAVVGRTERMATVARERYGLEPVGPRQVRPVDVLSDEHAALALE